MFKTKTYEGKIKSARIAKGWTQADLAMATGLSFNTVAFAERGQHMTQETADLIGAALGLADLPAIEKRKNGSRKEGS